MSSVRDDHWATLDKYRASAERMFVAEVLPFPDKLGGYDQAVAAARDALEGRGMDMTQEEQVFVVASTIAWMSNFVAGLTAARCQDPHVFAHLREALSWPAFLVRELTLDVPAVNSKEDNDEQA